METMQVLKNLGLTEQEARIYLAALELGAASIQKVAARANIKRPTAYTIAKELMSKGFMGSFVDRGGLKLTAETPDKLLVIAKRRQEDLAGILPRLQALRATKTDKPQITYYEGKEAYFVIAEDTLKFKNITAYMTGSLAGIHKVITEKYDLEYYIPKRVENNIAVKGIFSAEKVTKKYHTLDKAHLREIKFIPDQFAYPTFQIIYGDRVAFFASQEEMFGFIIKSKDYAEMEKKKFEFMWSKL